MGKVRLLLCAVLPTLYIEYYVISRKCQIYVATMYLMKLKTGGNLASIEKNS